MLYRFLLRNNILDKTIIKNNDLFLNELEKQEIIKKYNSGDSSYKIAEEFLVNRTSIIRTLKINKINIRDNSENKRKYKIDSNYFNKIDSARKAYFLGLMYSDGNVHKDNNTCKVTLISDDKYVLEEFSNDLFGFINLTFSKTELNKEIVNLYIHNKQIKQDLIKHGCFINKSFKIRLPELDYMFDFIRGVFDGDGSISISGKRCYVKITTNIDFAKDLQEYLSRFDIKSGIYQYKKSKAVDLVISKPCCKLFLDKIYISDLCIKRKYNKYLEYYI